VTGRIGIDVGGTFTDLIHYDDRSGETIVAKVPTTPRSPAEGCLKAIFQAVPEADLADVRQLLYGTTVGLNALLERKGAVVGLLASAGFRDILDIRRGNRLDVYDLFYRPPPALVPRRRRIGITERMRADGKVHIPLAREQIRPALARLREEGVDSIAIAFMHAYANPAHELEAFEELRAAGFDGEITLSHRISGEYREYERTCTTVIDAFVRGRIASDLDQVQKSLRGAGYSGELLVTRSGGGAMTFAEAEQRSFEAIQSGPVGGAEGAAELARVLDLGDVITADVGGTSFDTCVIQAGRMPLLYQGEIIGLPLQCPWVDVRSIGAGGGSIIQVDAGGLLQVGPHSAGAIPGPACYGHGGTEATLTDAAMVLGMLGTAQLISGFELDMQAARRALEPPARVLGCSVEQVAEGAVRIAASKMANAIREITIERGLDPRSMTLMTFGGAGPMFGTLIAGELGISRIVVPRHAGNFSAWGMLGVDVVRGASATRIMALEDGALTTTEAILKELFAALEARTDGPQRQVGCAHEVVLEIRYQGQEHTLPIAAAWSDAKLDTSSEQIRGTFIEHYTRAFGSELGAWPLEIVAVRATLRQVLPARNHPRLSGNGAWKANAQVDGYSFTNRAATSFSIVDRTALGPREVVLGPAVIREPTSTTYLDAGFKATIDWIGCMHLEPMERMS